MKKNYGFLLSISSVLVFTTAFAQNSIKSWKEYKFSDGGYAVKLPSKPQYQKQAANTAVGNLDLHMQISLSGADVFMTAHAKFGKKANVDANIKGFLDGAQNGALKNTQGKLLWSRDLKVLGSAAREFAYINPQKIYFTQRLWARNGVMYQLITGSQNDNTKSSVVQDFMNSFRYVN